MSTSIIALAPLLAAAMLPPMARVTWVWPRGVRFWIDGSRCLTRRFINLNWRG
jgi:hypothetical protein